MLSDSEVEDDPNSHVSLPQSVGPRVTKGNQAAVRLTEYGPRITLQVKIIVKYVTSISQSSTSKITIPFVATIYFHRIIIIILARIYFSAYKGGRRDNGR